MNSIPAAIKSWALRFYSVSSDWISHRPQETLILLTLLCLLPFSGKAFHLDDPLFIWAAQQITKHPLNPYGFQVVWYAYRMPMSEVAQNPPLASYFAALVGSVAGWSETALHLGFVLPALGVVLGTYRLARRFTQRPLIAATATLLAPGFLISATGLMCDTMMLALWVLAAVFWIEGLDEPEKPVYLAISGLLIAACALTKYFGVSLIPLLLVYSLLRKRRMGSWVGFLLLSLLIAAGYEFWTRALYGRGLFLSAINYSGMAHGAVRDQVSLSGQALVGLVFAGGCALPALTFIPALWSRKQILVGGIVSGLLAFSFFRAWINLGTYYADQNWEHEHLALVSSQMLFYIAGGISVLALASVDLWKKKDATSLLLFLWVAGTLVFAIFLNWVVTARSILPLVPATAILIARRLDERRTHAHSLALVVPLILSGVVSLWVTSGDTALANAARTMANSIHQQILKEPRGVEFQGHWGFQYYMESFGARPLEAGGYSANPGDLIVIPKNNVNLFPISLHTTEDGSVDIDTDSWAATMSKEVGAGFYFSGWGPLPFAFGPVPPERYYLLKVAGP